MATTGFDTQQGTGSMLEPSLFLNYTHTTLMSYYAVHNGRETGIFTDWASCKDAVSGYSGAQYKKFDDRAAAQYFAQTGEEPDPAAKKGVQKRRGTDNIVRVYVDGSDVHGSLGWAIVVCHGDEKVHEAAGNMPDAPSDLRKQSNVAAELKAAMEAAKWLRKNDVDGVIVHDYEGIAKWAEGTWSANNRWTRKYAEWMGAQLSGGNVAGFEWVKGHSGVRGNERADTLAERTARGFETDLNREETRTEKEGREGENCPRCGGSGHLAQYEHVEGGVCFRCDGDGISNW